MNNLSGMERARRALESGGHLPGGALPAVIAESWSRCRALGLDPRGAAREVVANFAEVRRRREGLSTLRRLALAEMQVLHGQIAGSNFMIAFGDADGIVLDTISDPAFSDSAAGRAIIPGSQWNETERGTNALGLARITREMAAVYGREHYFARHAHLSCIAAPIIDGRGRLLGVLDASCAHEARQEHTAALVRMAATQIENGLVFQDFSDRVILAFHPRAEFLGTLTAGLIAASSDGELLALNRPGRALLAGLPTEGRRFDDVFSTRFGEAMSGLLAGDVVQARDRAGSHVFMVCRNIGQRVAIAKRAEVVAPRGVLRDMKSPATFICEDPALKRSLKDLDAAIAMRMPVHIAGQTGSGKELMARHVHERSERKGEFIAFNCGAVAESLFIAELFGHERGAYTNAREDGALGVARAADRGTLFLDEVADIPLSAQTAFLRFLDGMEVRPVGSHKSQRVDVQIVSATNRPLQQLVREGRFRADLYFRLNGYAIDLPPLSARSDFAAISRHLLAELAPGAALTDAAIAALARRDWPGNIRQLRTELQRALVRRGAGPLDEGAFEERESAASPACCEACAGHRIRRMKCEEIRTTYRQHNGNASVTARMLGLSRTTVYKHLRQRVVAFAETGNESWPFKNRA